MCRSWPPGTHVESSAGDPVLAYRTAERLTGSAAALQVLLRKARAAPHSSSHDAVREVFSDYGEFEAAVADGIFPNRDGFHRLTVSLRGGALSAGHALLGSWTRDRGRAEEGLSRLVQVLEALNPAELPRSIALRVSEGYAYYSLHPETYAIAAERFAADHSPDCAVSVGIRNIGVSLSAVVAASLEARGVKVSLHSVRPHGHPFDRRVHIDDDLAREWRTRSAGSYFLIVDEGPGLSGSSFASVACALTGLGIDPSRIMLFPSWNPDGAGFRSETARHVWRQHRRYCATTRDAGFTPAQIAGAAGRDMVDLSGGAWRPHFMSSQEDWPAVQPQHEVEKAWMPAGRSIARFAGIGGYGAVKWHRADALAGAGLGANPLWLNAGYLSLERIEGTPTARATPALVDAVADHTAFLVRRFPDTRSPETSVLEEMIETNMRLALGDAMSPMDLLPFRTALANAPCAAIDGRMFRHEWIDTGSRHVKVDALDHHADHFFPGIQDAGWDLAAAGFELNLGPAAMARLVARYVAGSGDRDIAARLPFYALAYPAFRIGYATLARQSTAGHPDQARFERVIAACRARLLELLACAPGRQTRITSPSAP
jgi:hypothetical protein